MSELDVVRASVQATAAACAEVLGDLVGATGSFDEFEVQDPSAKPWEALEFPLVCIAVKLTGGVNGEYLFVLAPDQARIIASAMMGVAPGDADSPIGALVVLEELSPGVFAGGQAAEDRVDDAGGAVHHVERRREAMHVDLVLRQMSRILVSNPAGIN